MTSSQSPSLMNTLSKWYLPVLVGIISYSMILAYLLGFFRDEPSLDAENEGLITFIYTFFVIAFLTLFYMQLRIHGKLNVILKKMNS